MSQHNTPLSVGDSAPDLALASTSGETVHLSAFRARQHVLLAFFPLAFTSTCTAELCAFSEDFDQFSALDVTVLPLSVDAVPSLAEFRRKYDMKVHLLSDLKREASRAFGVLREDAFISERAYFLIDRDGRIAWSHVEAKLGDRRENSELLAAIAAQLGQPALPTEA
jgi:peroxiredoxin